MQDFFSRFFFFCLLSPLFSFQINGLPKDIKFANSRVYELVLGSQPMLLNTAPQRPKKIKLSPCGPRVLCILLPLNFLLTDKTIVFPFTINLNAPETNKKKLVSICMILINYFFGFCGSILSFCPPQCI